MPIEPTGGQLKALVQDTRQGPVVMLNLLRFVEDGGRASYDRYAEGVEPCLREVGASLLWYGSGDSVVIGDEDADAWDAVLLVRYPSRAAFIDMVSSPAYQAIAHFRSEALVDSRLVACTELARP